MNFNSIIEEKKFNIGDRVISNSASFDMAGKVEYVYLHIGNQYIKKPHMRYKVLWDSGEIQDLSEVEILKDSGIFTDEQEQKIKDLVAEAIRENNKKVCVDLENAIKNGGGN